MARDPRLLAGLAAALAVCLSAGGVGAASTSSGSPPPMEHWDGTAWTQVPVSGRAELTAVAAVSATEVWAFGSVASE